MKCTIAAFLILVAAGAFAQDVRQRVATDAMVVDRVADAATSRRDLPSDLLQRIVNEDIEMMRGRRSDGTYEYATWDRFEAGRIRDGFSVQPRTDKMETLEVKGAFVYRVLIDVGERRLVVRKNRPLWIERVDLEYIALDSTVTERQTVEIKAWLQPGEVRPIDLPVIARQATARVIATAQEGGGYSNVTVALVQARLIDNADSPYADAVASAKSLLRALENNDIPAVRTAANRMRESIGGATAMAPVRPAAAPAVPAPAPVSAMPVTSSRDYAAQVELHAELQLIEDLLTGSESERRDGLDRLNQLIRRLRPR